MKKFSLTFLFIIIFMFIFSINVLATGVSNPETPTWDIYTKIKSIKFGEDSKGPFIEGQIDIADVLDGIKSASSSPSAILNISNGKTTNISLNKIDTTLFTYDYKVYLPVSTVNLTAGITVTLINPYNSLENKSVNIKINSAKNLGTTTKGTIIAYTSKNGELLITIGGKYVAKFGATLNSKNLRGQ